MSKLKTDDLFQVTKTFVPHGSVVPLEQHSVIVVIDVGDNLVEVMSQRGYRYHILLEDFNRNIFTRCVRILYGKKGCIFPPITAEPINNGPYDFDKPAVIGKQFTPVNTFVVRDHKSNIIVIPVGDIIEVECIKDADSLDFIYDRGGKIHNFSMSIKDIECFGLSSVTDELAVKEEEIKELEYMLYLRAFIFAKTGGIFEFEGGDYTEEDLIIIVRGVCDAKKNNYPQRKDSFEPDWKYAAIDANKR